MRKHLYSFATLCALFCPPCYAMQWAREPYNSLREITVLKKPRALSFLNEQQIVLANKDGCSIISTQSNTKVAQLHNIPTLHTIIDPSKKKLLSWNWGMLNVYDIEQQQVLWTHESDYFLLSSAAFSPTDDTIFVYKKKKVMTNNYKQYPLLSKIPGEFAIACHPTEKRIIYPSDSYTISTIDFDNNQPIRSHLRIKNLYPSRYLQATFYNADASYIALIHNNNKDMHVTIYNTTQKTSHYLGSCCAMKFHPNNSIATMLLKNGLIDFWNIKTNTLILKIKISPANYLQSLLDPYEIDFSPKGTQFAILINNKCFIGIVPSILYEPNAKNVCIFVCYMLKHFHYDKYNVLPQDIGHLIMNNLLEISQF